MPAPSKWDRRSEAAKAWRKFYQTAAWKEVRAIQLTKEPLCERCQVRGKIVAATVVNHRKAHKGNWELFIAGDNHESLCKPCHDGQVQSEERVGYSNVVGPDGWPSDPNHPANRMPTPHGTRGCSRS